MSDDPIKQERDAEEGTQEATDEPVTDAETYTQPPAVEGRVTSVGKTQEEEEAEAAAANEPEADQRRDPLRDDEVVRDEDDPA